jgi:hypothetical protein
LLFPFQIELLDGLGSRSHEITAFACASLLIIRKLSRFKGKSRFDADVLAAFPEVWGAVRYAPLCERDKRLMGV